MGWARAILHPGRHRGSQTTWSRGAHGPVTLVEVEVTATPGTPRTSRLRDLMAAHERGGPAPDRSPGDPAFSEALFVELIRIGQYPSAFALLAPECQRRWGSSERFAAANRGDALSRLDGVSVGAVRHLDEWVDPDHGDRHRGVAELDVEYGFATGDRLSVLRRTVHLVAVDGRWRSLCYPVEA
ncbi:MAG: hypothetical protein WCB85_04175 [Candidatus Dormiibacterota bacterium]